MISNDPAVFRAFQSRMTTVGKIRLGIYETPEGRRGRPVKLDTFRFTSENEALIRAVAEAYGGTPEQWTPQGSKTAEWQVISDAKAIPVYIVNGQDLDPWYEAWAGGRTCVRRCDGIVNKITQELCVCIPADGSPSALAPRDQCKPTTRAQLMLAEIPGLGSWLLESHGENAARELSTFREFIAAAPMPVPAMLRLRHETRRQWSFEKKKFDTLDFYVPWFDISAINAEQIAIGGDALTQALAAAGAPAIGGSAQLAIEARPVSAPAAPAQEPMVPPAPLDIERLRPRILADIEAQITAEGLDAIRTKLKGRGINDDRVIEAWKSKLAAVQAAETLRTAVERPYRVLVTGSRTWTDVDTLNEQLNLAWTVHRGRMVLMHGDCPQGADALADTWAEVNGVPVERHPADWNLHGKKAGIIRNEDMVATRPDIVLSFNRGNSPGTAHCTRVAEAAGLKVLKFVDDTPVVPEVPESLPPRGIIRTQTDRRPCFDPYCAGGPAPCGFTPGQHLEAHGADGIIEADRAAGRIPGTPEYRVGDTVTVGGIEFTKVREMPGIEDMLFQAQQEEALNPDPGEAVDGTVETPGPVLPDVPAGDYDADEMYTLLMTGAGQQAPPLTTAEVNALILRTFPANDVGLVGGYELARLRAGLKAGTVAWR